MEYYQADIEQLTKNANAVKEAVLNALERDGLLTKKASEIGESYAVVLSKPGWFGKMFRLFKGDPTPGYMSVDVVKLV